MDSSKKLLKSYYSNDVLRSSAKRIADETHLAEFLRFGPDLNRKGVMFVVPGHLKFCVKRDETHAKTF